MCIRFFLVCLGFYVPLESFSLVRRCLHYRWRASNFDLYYALMAIEQWGFFSMPHLRHGPTVYNGHFRGPATLRSVAERLTVELSLPTFTPWVCRSWNSNTKPSACEANALIVYSTAAVFTTSLYLKKNNWTNLNFLKCLVWLKW